MNFAQIVSVVETGYAAYLALKDSGTWDKAVALFVEAEADFKGPQVQAFLTALKTLKL